MMTWIITAMIALSVVLGVINGRAEQVSSAAIHGGIEAVQLSITLLGGMCLWSGVMRVAQAAGLTERFCRLLTPVTKRLFRGVDPHGKAAQAITMNIAANLLGLGNAATPLGILAVKELSVELGSEKSPPHPMILFVVLNTASMTLIPTTVATLRLEYGASSPMDILPCVWLSSATSILCAVGLTIVIGAAKGERKKGRPEKKS